MSTMTQRVLAAMAVGGLLAACGGETDTGDQSTAPPPVREPTPYVPQLEDEPVSPGLDVQALDRVLTAQIRTLMNVDGSQVPAALESMIDLTDPDCPGGERYEEDGFEWVSVINECTTADGTQFQGEMRLGRAVEEAEGGERGLVLEAGGGVRIDAPDGRYLALSGYMEIGGGQEDGGTQEYVFLGIRVDADPQTAGDDPLLNGQVGGQLGRYTFLAEDGNMAVGLTIAQTVDDPAISAIQLDDVVINTWLCSEEPAGTISVREAGGQWHDLIYDGFDPGDEESGVEPTAGDGCDRCALHLFNGDREADACEGNGWVNALLEEARR